MDVAYAALIVEVLKLLCTEQWLDGEGMNRWRTEELGKLLTLAARQGEQAGIGDKQYLAAFGLRSSGIELKGLWEHLIETVSARGSLAPRHGPVARALSAPWHARDADRQSRRAAADAGQAREGLRRALRSARATAGRSRRRRLLVSCEHGAKKGKR